MPNTPHNSTLANSTAPSPFDGSQRLADIIISTADHVDFYLAKTILSFASPFFTIVQPPKEKPSEFDRIDVTEDSETFETLMRLCYPIQRPTITEFTLLEKVLEAGLKYQMEIADDLVDTLRRFIPQKPLQCFAVACRLRLIPEMLRAAETWKAHATSLSDTSESFAATIAGGSWVPEMSKLPTAVYRSLLEYLRNPGRDTPSSFSSPPPVMRAVTNPRNWAKTICTAGTDYILRSADGAQTFPVHSAVLRVGHAEKLLQGRPAGTEGKGEQGQTIVIVDLNGDSLHAILRFCYPSTSSVTPPSLHEIFLVLEAAKKLEMLHVEVTARRQMKSFIEQEPLRIYMFAAMNGWIDEAQEAARRLATSGTHDAYVAEMEYVPASAYYGLLKYLHAAAQAAQKIVQKHAPNASIWSSAPNKQLEALPASLVLALMDYSDSSLWPGPRSLCAFCHSYSSTTGRATSRSCPYCTPTLGHADSGAGVLEKGKRIEQEIREAIAKLKLDL